MSEFTPFESPGFDLSPRHKFSTLFLAHGYSMSKVWSLVTDGWKKVMQVHPFDLEKKHNREFAKRRFAAYVGTTPVDLGFVQNGKELEIPESHSEVLLRHLETSTVRVNYKGERTWPAMRVWQRLGRIGDTGSLVVVLVKGNSEGELYQLSASPRYPVPLVAVVVHGDHWPKVIARAVAQSFLRLADEFERAESAYKKPEKEALDATRKNILIVSDSERAELKSGKAFRDVLGHRQGWLVGKNKALSFHAHPEGGSIPDEKLRKANGDLQLVEGAGGYRLNVFRGDFDCLMRREPGSTTLPIQTRDAKFCGVCRRLLSVAIVANRTIDLTGTRRILLDSQLPLVDAQRWEKKKEKKIPSSGLVEDMSANGPKGAKWRYKLHVDRQSGMKLTAVRLVDRPGDPFEAAEHTFESIEFRDLKVRFRDSEHDLPMHKAFANTTHPPKLEVFDDGWEPYCIHAVKLTLRWSFPKDWDIEAVLSVVFKDVNNDFDPGGAVYACKLYPQLAMRFRRHPKVKERRPHVSWLRGAIRLKANNVFPTSIAGTLHEDLKHMASGKLQSMLFVDSNSSGWDSKWEWDQLHVAQFGNDFLNFLKAVFGGTQTALPKWGLWKAEWKSGRLLAEVKEGSMTSPASLVAPTARRGNLHADQPGLPHWSWLFDYASPILTSKKKFVAVYARGEQAMGSPADRLRSAGLAWPKSSDQDGFVARNYQMTIVKFGRQGAYDNVHVKPDMGKDSRGRPIIPAPFCGELCMHLHFRWGTVALAGIDVRRPFLGWGDGRLDGAHTVLGAPLVPPNQRVEVEVDPGNSATTIVYDVRADRPDYDAYQVFMEQGCAFAFNYQGLQPRLLGLLATGMGVWGPTDLTSKTRELRRLRRNDAAAYDRRVRHVFHKIYVAMRWYSEAGIKDDVQQIPAVSGAPSTLELL